MKKHVYFVSIFIFSGWVCCQCAAQLDKPVEISPDLSLASQEAALLSKDDKTPSVARKPEPEKRDRVKEMREIIQNANQPVVFYGRVIDQDNAPLPGVKVKLSLKRLEKTFLGGSADKINHIDATTDSNGLFSLTNQKGSLLGVSSLTKDGYKAPYYGHLGYWYQELVKGEKYVPEANSPEVFRMYKVFGAERLLVREFPPTPIGPEVPEEGVSVHFDILNGKKLPEGGDIRVTLKRTQIAFDSRPKYAWDATIESLSGGVILSEDELMYRAPELGYKSKVSVTFSNGLSSKRVHLFLKIGDKYARVTTEFGFSSRDAKGKIDYMDAYINPTESRNLEYDSSLRIK